MVTKTSDRTVDETLHQTLENLIVSNLVSPSDLEEIGTRFGIYGAMSRFGPVSTEELAAYTGLSEVATVAWLGGQLARDTIAYDVNTGRYSLWCNWPPLR